MFRRVRQVAVPVGRQTTTTVSGRSLLSTIALLYPPSERSEIGGYTVFTSVGSRVSAEI